MFEGFLELGQRSTQSSLFPKPKLITLGGDHAIALPALRALHKIHGKPLSVVHFDAHLDTWHPDKYMSAWPSEQAAFNHGSMFWLASLEGLISNTSSAHAGIRCRLAGVDEGDYTDPGPETGFIRIHADDIDDIGPKGVIAAIRDRVGSDENGMPNPVYLSVDIDVLDPGIAGGTGTPEPGGWTTRELIRILRGIEDLNVVGADIVEVAPAYDGPGEETSLAAAQVVFEILSSMVKAGLQKVDSDSKHSGIKEEL